MPKKFVITGPFQGEFSDEPCPTPTAGEALCRPICIGLCGTDRLIFAGAMPAATFPRVPCHEVVAEVLEDRSERRLAPGTLVCVDPYKNCGVCHACRAGRPNCCRQNQTLGVQRDGILR
jgi:L-galactonate 5-dehydrogenase